MKVKVETLAVSVAIILLLSLIIVPTRTMGDPTTIHVPGDFGTIQEAIDAANPGDTVSVGAGIYREAISINKALNVVGVGADSSFINGSGVVLASAGLVKITCNSGDVLFSGFTVCDAELFGGARIGILTSSNLAGPKYMVSYNKIYGSNNPDEEEDYGVYAQSGKENLVFTYNLVTGTGANNLVLECHTGASEIAHNSLDAGVWGVDSIFLMTYNGIDVVALQNVSYNTFDMGTGGPFDYDHRATGISFASPGPAWGLTEARFTNIVITGNNFNNLMDYRRGIGFWNAGTGENLVAPVVTYNVVNGVAGSVGSFGIDFYGLTTNTMIAYNTIEGTEAAISLRSGEAPGTVIHYNNIANNVAGLDWSIASSGVDSSLNWWGDPTGPYDPVRNPDGQGDLVSGDVTFEPWLTAPYPPLTQVEALLFVDPENTEFWTVSKGQTFTIEVKLTDVTLLYGLEFKVYWDTLLLDLVGVDVISPWGSSYFIAKNETREDLGRYWLAVSAYLTPAFTGDATLARLTFRVAYDPIYPAGENCAIDLADTKLSTYDGVAIYHMTHDGIYSIYSTKPVLAISPNSYTSHYLGETFKVNVTVSNVVDLYNFTIKLSYDTVLLDATSMQLGPFLNTPVYISKFIIDDSSGLIWLSAWSAGSALPASGNGVLATITFKSIKATLWRTTNANILTCQLNLYDTLLITNEHVSVAHDVSCGTYYYAPKPGDLDYDGKVGLTDFRTVAYYFDPYYDSVADINTDGRVDVFDLSIVGTHYGEDC